MLGCIEKFIKKMPFADIANQYQWINRKFVEQCLNIDAKQVKIDRIDVRAALNHGENYSSQLIRVKVDYRYLNDAQAACNNTIQHKSFIIKIFSGLDRSRDVFAKEIFVYKGIIPKVEALLQQIHIPAKLAPKCFIGNQQSSYLVLEDLTAESYANIDRKRGLNRSQLQMCLKTLAKWHAGTAKLVDGTLPQLYELYLHPHVSITGSKHYRTLFENAVSSCEQAFQNSSDLGDILRKLNRMKENIFEKCCAAVERRESDFNVLNHGDLWSNNVMFNNSMDPLLIDFQVGYWGSPVLDVSYLLFTSSNEDLSPSDWDRLLHFYFDELISTLNQLNFTKTIMPKRQQLFEGFIKRGRYGAFFSLFTVPLRVSEDAGNDAVKKFLNIAEDGQEYRSKLYLNPAARNLLKNLLFYFDGKGFLD